MAGQPGTSQMPRARATTADCSIWLPVEVTFLASGCSGLCRVEGHGHRVCIMQPPGYRPALSRHKPDLASTMHHRGQKSGGLPAVWSHFETTENWAVPSASLIPSADHLLHSLGGSTSEYIGSSEQGGL